MACRGQVRKCVWACVCVETYESSKFLSYQSESFEVEVYVVGLPQAQFLFLQRETVFLITTDNPMMRL